MDIKRTVLLVVFSLSLLMLWENWNRYSNPPQPQAVDATSQTTAAPAKDASLPQPSAAAPTPASAPTGELPATSPPATVGEAITLTTDLLKVEISTLGGDITRVELLKHQDSKETGNPVVLFQKNINHTYVAQSGVIGGDFPNHRSLFVARDGTRTLSSGDTLQLQLDGEQG
ncbi:MAG: membrane protein insertase YidC, partial [Burkholderiaceae bacterium]